MAPSSLGAMADGDWEASEERVESEDARASRSARKVAESPLETALKTAQRQRSQGDGAGALRTIDQALERAGGAAVTRIRLLRLKAQIHQAQRNISAAEAANQRADTLQQAL